MPNTIPSTTSSIKRFDQAPIPLLHPQSARDRSLQIEDFANSLLRQHPHFVGRGQFVRCRCVKRCLYLVGTVPSYYLKQLAQEAIRQINNVKQIENRIVVANPQGLIPREETALVIRKPR